MLGKETEALILEKAKQHVRSHPPNYGQLPISLIRNPEISSEAK